MTGGIDLRPGLWALPDRAAWIVETETLVLADVHLGFSAVERRRGTSGPDADARTAAALQACLASRKPREIVLLGDIAHARPRNEAERLRIVQPLEALAREVDLHLVLGNHDRGLLRELPESLQARCTDALDRGGFHLSHGDKPAGKSGRFVLYGHLHPAATVPGATGAKTKFPAFVVGTGAALLPAFSPFAEGLNVLAARGRTLLNRLIPGDPVLYACSPSRVLRLGPIDRVAALVRER